MYSGGGNEDGSTRVERLDCPELPEGPLAHWIQCAKFYPPDPPLASVRLYLTLIVQLIFGGSVGSSALLLHFAVRVLNPLTARRAAEADLQTALQEETTTSVSPVAAALLGSE